MTASELCLKMEPALFILKSFVLFWTVRVVPRQGAVFLKEKEKEEKAFEANQISPQCAWGAAEGSPALGRKSSGVAWIHPSSSLSITPLSGCTSSFPMWAMSQSTSQSHTNLIILWHSVRYCPLEKV